MIPKERERFKRLLRFTTSSSSPGLFGINCLHCGRPLDTRLQRLWHRLVCRRKPHPKQARHRFGGQGEG